MRCRVCKQQGTNLKAGGFCPKCLGLNEPLRKLSLASQVELADRRMALEREAMQAIEDALAQHPMAYVAFSGGKDSTVVADLCRRIRPDILHVFHDDELLFSEQARYIRRMAERVNLTVVKGFTLQRGWFTPWESRPWWRFPFAGMVDTRMKSGKASMLVCRWLGYEMQIVGLHQQESRGRGELLAEVGTAPYPVYVWQQRTSIWRVQPLAHWRADDVWDYIHRYGLDYCRAYDDIMRVETKVQAQRISNMALAPARHIVACEGLATFQALEARYGKRWTDGNMGGGGPLRDILPPGH